MSTYVGWYYWGDVQVYNKSMKITTFHKISPADEDLSTFDKALDELIGIVKVAEVKQLVFINNSFNTKSCKSIVEKLTEKGFKSVYIQHWISNKFQTFLLKQNVEFTEGQHFLLAIKGKNEFSEVWRYCGGRIEFVKRGPMIEVSTEDQSIDDIKRLFNEFKIELMINMNCDKISGFVEKLFPKCKIVNQVGSWTSKDYAATALWTAKRQDGLIDGAEVGNFKWIRIQICIQKDFILDNKNDGIPLPFNWTSEWKLHKSATTASVTFGGFKTSVGVPANRHCRLNVKIDRNGALKIFIDEKQLACLIGISLSQDSFCLVRFSDSVEGMVDSTEEFPTALRFDCDPPKLASSVSGENVIADAIKMLDPKDQANNGWKCLRTSEGTEFCKLLEGNYGLITASYVVGELINNIKLLVADGFLDSEKLVCITLSQFLTEKQREKLTNIFKQKFLKIEFVDEILAAAYGYSVEKETDDGVTLIVDLRTTGCLFSVFRIEDSFCEQVEQQEHAELKSEVIRQAMRVLYPSGVPATEPASEIKAEMRKIITKFRQIIFDVGSKYVDVNNVLMLGCCHLVRNLMDLFERWSFFHANVVFLEESELCRLAATGSVLLDIF